MSRKRARSGSTRPCNQALNNTVINSVQFSLILNSTEYVHLFQVHINPRLQKYEQCKRKFNNINITEEIESRKASYYWTQGLNGFLSNRL